MHQSDSDIGPIRMQIAGLGIFDNMADLQVTCLCYFCILICQVFLQQFVHLLMQFYCLIEFELTTNNDSVYSYYTLRVRPLNNGGIHFKVKMSCIVFVRRLCSCDVFLLTVSHLTSLLNFSYIHQA